MPILKGINLAVSFLLELAMLAAIGYWGFQQHRAIPAKLAYGVGIPVFIVVIWSRFLAPNSGHRIPWPWLLLVTLVFFLVAAVALLAAGQRTVGLLMAALAVVNVALVYLLQQR